MPQKINNKQVKTLETSIAVSVSGVTGTIWVYKRSGWIFVQYDLSGTVATDIVVASLPAGFTGMTAGRLTLGGEYQYGTGAGAQNQTYLNGTIDIRVPAQGSVNRRRGTMIFPAVD